MENKEYRWNEYYELAKEYYEKNGNLDISVTYVTEDGKKLGIWIAQQRRAYKAKYNISKTKLIPLTDEKIEKLNSIGMIWDVKIYNLIHKPYNRERKISLEIKFYRYLKEYVKENKNEIETYDDVKNIGNAFVNRLEKLSKSK